MVELRGFEPLTFSLPTAECATNAANRKRQPEGHRHLVELRGFEPLTFSLPTAECATRGNATEARLAESGGAEGIRTPDLLIANGRVRYPRRRTATRSLWWS